MNNMDGPKAIKTMRDLGYKGRIYVTLHVLFIFTCNLTLTLAPSVSLSLSLSHTLPRSLSGIIIGLTGHHGPEKYGEFMDSGANRVLSKPLNMDSLMTFLKGDTLQGVCVCVCV